MVKPQIAPDCSGICIMGIDPGSLVAGVAVISSKYSKPLRPKDYSVLDVLTLSAKQSMPLNKRVQLFHNTIYNLVVEHKPTHVAVETCYFGKNPQTALKLGLIRGAIIAAVGRCNLGLKEMTPTQIKKRITGNGHASKEDVALALKVLLDYESHGLSHDASDALAIAVSYGISSEIQSPISSFST